MQLLFALALLFVSASAQAGFYKVDLWDDCNCNGTLLYTEYSSVTDIAADCTPFIQTCECFSLAAKRAIDAYGGAEAISCPTAFATNNVDGISNTFAGYIQYSSNLFCNESISFTEEYLIGTCLTFNGGTSYLMASCNDDTAESTVETFNDENCTPANSTGITVYNQTCDDDGVGNGLLGSCVVVTPAPTEAPTEPPTEAPTDAPTPGTSGVTIFDIRAICKVSAVRAALELVLSATVTEATGVTALCTISNCDATENYDGAQFKYSCKSTDGASFDDTTAAQICPAIVSAIETTLEIADGSSSCPTDDQSGNPTGTKGLVVITPLEASASFMTTSFFMLVALLLANLF